MVFAEDLDTAARAELDVGGISARSPETPGSTHVARDDARRLTRAIESLPVPFREALVLYEYHGLGYRENAEVTRVPIGKAMSRLGRARQRLLQQLHRDQR